MLLTPKTNLNFCYDLATENGKVRSNYEQEYIAKDEARRNAYACSVGIAASFNIVERT
jgi:hypothetical protein